MSGPRVAPPVAPPVAQPAALRVTRLVGLAVAVLIGIPAHRDAFAGGPLLVDRGVPLRWTTAAPVRLNPDQGPLGDFSNEEAVALVEEATTPWNDVGTSALRVAVGDDIGRDIEGLDLKQFNALVTRNDGTNPVIFDADGSIIDSIFGAGSGVLGVAGPSLVVPSSRTIIKGFAVFNGRRAQRSGRAALVAVIVHEMGHVLNLGHSQINGIRLGRSLPGFSGSPTSANVETMFPLLLQSSANPHPMSTLHRDDIAAISALYPAPGFRENTGTISGHVLDIDRATPIQGVNVVARNAIDPFDDAVSYVSGHLAGTTITDATRGLLGKYELPGLTPGGRYKVYIEEVSAFFTGGSSVGPLDPPRDIDRTDPAAFLEFYNGTNEDSENPPDDPEEAVELMPEAGWTMGDVDFIFNGVAPRVTSIQPPYASYAANQDVIVSGANLLGTQSVRIEGEETIYLAAVEELDASRLRAIVPQGSMPGTYAVIVKTGRGESEPGEVEYRVTEPLPTIFSVEPVVFQNDKAHRLGIDGLDLLGTRSARLTAEGRPEVPLVVLRVFGADLVLLELAAGAFPGTYAVRVTNTEGESPPGPQLVEVTELGPVLTGWINPSSAPTSAQRTVTIEGVNLVGTTGVELIGDEETIPLSIQSTSLTTVVVLIPAGLDPGAYEIRLTNTMGSVTGPTQYVVEPARSGGGGCGALPALPGGGAGSPFGGGDGGRGGAGELPLFLALAILASILRRIRTARPVAEGARR